MVVLFVKVPTWGCPQLFVYFSVLSRIRNILQITVRFRSPHIRAGDVIQKIFYK